MRNLTWSSLFVLTSVLVGASCPAQTTRPEPPRAVDTIRKQIESKDSEQVKAAVETIWEQLHSSDINDVRTAVRGMVWRHQLDALMDAQRYEDVERLSLEAILALAGDTNSTELLQAYRVRALLKLGKPKEALAAAKGEFNVCRMKSVPNALQHVVDCLKVAHPGEEAIINRFRQEQIEGARESSQSSVPGRQSTVLAGVKVDGSVFEKGMQRYTRENYRDWASLGNLLLLADKPKEARPLFERAYGVAKTNTLAAATESIARCMKAEDGTVGRANAWLLSIQPKE
jgi:tetratricopeptide (TPR) repeat protein